MNTIPRKPKAPQHSQPSPTGRRTPAVLHARKPTAHPARQFSAEKRATSLADQAVKAIERAGVAALKFFMLNLSGDFLSVAQTEVHQCGDPANHHAYAVEVVLGPHPARQLIYDLWFCRNEECRDARVSRPPVMLAEMFELEEQHLMKTREQANWLILESEKIKAMAGAEQEQALRAKRARKRERLETAALKVLST